MEIALQIQKYKIGKTIAVAREIDKYCKIEELVNNCLLYTSDAADD